MSNPSAFSIEKNFALGLVALTWKESSSFSFRTFHPAESGKINST
jgi:hypothetical protein